MCRKILVTHPIYVRENILIFFIYFISLDLNGEINGYSTLAMVSCGNKITS